VLTRTEADTWVLLTNIVTLIVGEEHVGRETTLGGIGVCANHGQLRSD
jgi:predicted ATPase